MRQSDARRAHFCASRASLTETNMKQVVLTLSRVFPATHPRHGEQTLFREHLGNTLHNAHDGRDKRKLHTIRTNYDRWVHNIKKVNDGDFFVSIRQWQGKPYRSKHAEVMQFRRKLGYQRITLIYDNSTDSLSCYIDGTAHYDIEQLAANDGLTLEDFKAWFFPPSTREKRNVIHGIIIHFTDFRY